MRIEDVDELLRCGSCGWKGDRGRVVERQADLLFYDQTLNIMYGMGVTRWNLICPHCASVIRSVRRFASEARKPKA